jgi:hypothetical protein
MIPGAPSADGVLGRDRDYFMPFKPITHQSKPLSLHKALIAPEFNSKTVLVVDTWDFVDLWLKRRHHDRAQFYWQQARSFFEASAQLPKASAPLTSYYSFLNAAKALLSVKGRAVPPRHGVDGDSQGNRTSLSNEMVTFQSSGVLSELCRYLGEPTAGTYSLKDLLYNLPWIHRAYGLTYSSTPELFTPIVQPQFVKKVRSQEAWFCAEIEEQRYANQHTVNKLPTGYERDLGVKDRFVIRRSSRFQWRHGRGNLAGNLQRLARYHRTVRKHMLYIHGPSRLWYLKRGGPVPGLVDRSSATITFGAMHRLSELARYKPISLARHFGCHHNWLLSEFISTALYQFIDELSAEMTGYEFMIPGRKSVA